MSCCRGCPPNAELLLNRESSRRASVFVAIGRGTLTASRAITHLHKLHVHVCTGEADVSFPFLHSLVSWTYQIHHSFVII